MLVCVHAGLVRPQDFTQFLFIFACGTQQRLQCSLFKAGRPPHMQERPLTSSFFDRPVTVRQAGLLQIGFTAAVLHSIMPSVPSSDRNPATSCSPAASSQAACSAAAASS